MIRTAILAGIFMVLLSIAYSRPGAGLLSATNQDESGVATIPLQPALKHVARAAVPVAAPAVQVAPPQAKPIEPVHVEEAATPAVPVTVSVAAPIVAQEAPRMAGQPVSLLPPIAAPRLQAVAEAPAPLVPPPSLPSMSENVPAAPAAVPPPAAVVAVMPAADIPTINVAARPVMTPWEAPPRARTATVAATQEIAAKAPEEAAPKLMTPQERSRELYRLAREMEDTFIHKLAR